MPITKEQFDAAKAANPGVEIEVLQHDKLPDEVLARVPSIETYTLFRNMQADGKKVEASLFLVQSSVLAPDRAGLMKMLEARPGLIEVWAGEIIEMAGVSGGARRKKF
jgi:hypothetical protein